MTVMPPALDERVLSLLRDEFAARADGYDRGGAFAHENIEAKVSLACMPSTAVSRS